MPSSKPIKSIFKWTIIICIILLIIISISTSMNKTDSISSNENSKLNISHNNDDSIDISNDEYYENNTIIESDDNSNKNYQGVDDSPYTLAKNDPDWYYDHYDYGDYDEIDEYLESQGY